MVSNFIHQLFYSNKGWFCIKLFLLLHWFSVIAYMLYQLNGAPLPNGICELFDCGLFTYMPVKFFLLILSVIALSFYCVEKLMIPSLFIISIISFLIISTHESNGILMRASLFTMVWVGQLLAYIFYKKDEAKLTKYRHQFVVQLIAATYTLAAVSKLHQSGFQWTHDGANFLAINALKGFLYNYYDSHDINALKEGYQMANLLLSNKTLVFYMLWSALLLELFAFIAVLDIRITLIYGILLFAMHIGIEYVMHILIAGTFYSMIAFFINPFGILYFGFVALRAKLSIHSKSV